MSTNKAFEEVAVEDVLSYKGNPYGLVYNNAIISNEPGNSELAAKQVAGATGAKMIRLLPEQPYSSEDVDWVNEQSRCTQEHLNQSLRPAIKPVDIDFTKVDTVFVGFPIW